MDNWIVRTVYGKDGDHISPYLTMISLSPRTRFGQLKIHIFHRGDMDPHMHDHPFNFWTFPFVPYIEEKEVDGVIKEFLVERFRIHYRPATYTHRVIRAQGVERKIITLLWKCAPIREWGFHVGGKWVDWQTYIYGKPDNARAGKSQTATS